MYVRTNGTNHSSPNGAIYHISTADSSNATKTTNPRASSQQNTSNACSTSSASITSPSTRTTPTTPKWEWTPRCSARFSRTSSKTTKTKEPSTHQRRLCATCARSRSSHTSRLTQVLPKRKFATSFFHQKKALQTYQRNGDVVL